MTDEIQGDIEAPAVEPIAEVVAAPVTPKYTVLLPTDATATALAFDSEHDTLLAAVVACGDIPGATVEQAVIGGTSIVFRNPHPSDAPAPEGEPTALPATSGPVPQWVQFAAALTADPAVNTLVGTAAQVAPVLHLMLGVGLGQAAKGDIKTFVAAWAAATGAGLVSAELIEHMQELATSHDLPAGFIAGLFPAEVP